jgi:hypothetical protein
MSKSRTQRARERDLALVTEAVSDAVSEVLPRLIQRELHASDRQRSVCGESASACVPRTPMELRAMAERWRADLGRRNPRALMAIDRLAKGVSATHLPLPGESRAATPRTEVSSHVAAEHARNRAKIAELLRRQMPVRPKPARSPSVQRMIDESTHAGVTRQLRTLGLRPHSLRGP